MALCLAHMVASSSLKYSSPEGHWLMPSQVSADEIQNNVSSLQVKEKRCFFYFANFPELSNDKSYPYLRHGCCACLQWKPFANAVITNLNFGEWWLGVHETRSLPCINRTDSRLIPRASNWHGSILHGGINGSFPDVWNECDKSNRCFESDVFCAKIPADIMCSQCFEYRNRVTSQLAAITRYWWRNEDSQTHCDKTRISTFQQKSFTLNENSGFHCFFH